MDSHEIAQLRGQFQARQWPKWLESVTISGLRGWVGQTVTFGFPVCALVGENGSGKSTILRAAACAYESDGGSPFYPSDFFLDTQWETIRNVALDYQVRQGAAHEPVRIRKPTERWSYPEKRPHRHVFFHDVSRILPLDATIGYAKLAKQKAAEVSTVEISDDFRKRLGYVLSRDYAKARFATTALDAKKPVGLLTRDFGEISQFHQGAGEDATLDLFAQLQSIPDTSLLIIDEVEASLHPRAQRRLIAFLLWLSRTKRLQIIVSTHSPYVLEELPQEARMLLLPGPAGVNVVYGATAEFSLTKLDESVHPGVHVFVEDREAEIWLREILASDRTGAELLQAIDIRSVGPANVVEMLGNLGSANRLPYRVLAVTDGDATASANTVRLPGNAAPERVVFGDLKQKGWPDCVNRFGIGAGDLFACLDDAMRAPDHHDWPKLVEDRIRKSRVSVWETLANIWCRYCLAPTDVQGLVGAINERLPRT